MDKTAEQRAWLDGRNAGEMFGRMLQPARAASWGEAMSAAEPASRTPELFAAWLNGYGHGIADGAGAIPGHHFASVVMDSPPFKVRTELVPDHREVPPIPLDELAELNPGMGPKGLHRLQAMEQLLTEDDQANGIDPE